jgi:hypothetical protein
MSFPAIPLMSYSLNISGFMTPSFFTVYYCLKLVIV